MNALDASTSARIYDSLASGKKTRQQIAAELSLNPITVKTALTRMLSMGLVVVASTATTGRRGRPAFLYQQVSTNE